MVSGSGFKARMQEAMVGYTLWADDDTDFYQLVWVEPLVPGEPVPGEVWEEARDGRRVTITHPPYSTGDSDARWVPTDKGLCYVPALRPIPVHPWHWRADGSAEGRDKDPRARYDRRGDHRSTTRHFVERGKCDRKGDRRQNDE